MNSTTSTYLDATRFMAACFVFFHHMNDWSGKSLPIFAPMQSEAVLVFFVLSGFVIAYVVDTKEHNLGDFAVSRLARIYSVALPALIATFALDAMSSTSVSSFEQTIPPSSGVQFVSGLFFLNEVWGHHIPIGTNGPYWSLGYEVPYYIAFAGYAFGRGYWRYILPALVLAAYGPRVTMLAPIWIMGVASYRICKQNLIGARLGWLLFAGSSLVWALFYAGICLGVVPSSDVPIYWHHWEIIEDVFVGILFSMNVIGFHAVSGSFAGIARRCQGTVRWVAGATFTLYLFHYPLVNFLLSTFHWQIRGARDMILLTVVVGVIVFALAEVTERRKKFYRGLFRLVIKRPAIESA